MSTTIAGRIAGRAAGVIHRKMPWRCFALRAALAGLLVGPPAAYAAQRWSVAIDPQVSRCLPDVRAVLIDREATRPGRGQIAVFTAEAGRQRMFRPGSLVGKVVVGLPGDRITVGPDQTTVNGRLVGLGLLVARSLGQEDEDFVRELVVPEGHLWVMGATADSYDSRYWGPLPATSILGTGHALF
ncbi:signal peptidase I [Pseudoroseomonas sp. WGS1072]|uniref:signal peptidase I n=1 Tax=Roseomonas sp. WGS1072 TaxID=3366816 RepID=UPI003BF399DC